MNQSQHAPIAVTDASFTVDVLESPAPVLVDFWAHGADPAAPSRQCSSRLQSMEAR